MSEDAIVRAGHRELRDRGAYHFKTTGISEAGVPDDSACYRGRYIAIEYKQPGNYPTPNQRRHLELVTRAGGYAIVARSRQDVSDLLDRIDADIAAHAATKEAV